MVSNDLQLATSMHPPKQTTHTCIAFFMAVL
jgi:hypothetical protein